MTVFSLLVYSCVTINSFEGDLASKTCQWSQHTTPFYKAFEHCNIDGAELIGKPIFSDVADGRKIEKYKCQPMTVQ